MSLIVPAFDQFTNDEAIVGRLLVAFGGLEFMTVCCAGKIVDKGDSVLKALYRMRPHVGRIAAADALMRPYWNGLLLNDYDGMISALKFCHVHDECLVFTNPEESASLVEGLGYRWYHVDGALLATHEAYLRPPLYVGAKTA
jgi:hypothetical protein